MLPERAREARRTAVGLSAIARLASARAAPAPRPGAQDVDLISAMELSGANSTRCREAPHRAFTADRVAGAGKHHVGLHQKTLGEAVVGRRGLWRASASTPTFISPDTRRVQLSRLPPEASPVGRCRHSSRRRAWRFGGSRGSRASIAPARRVATPPGSIRLIGMLPPIRTRAQLCAEGPARRAIAGDGVEYCSSNRFDRALARLRISVVIAKSTVIISPAV